MTIHVLYFASLREAMGRQRDELAPGGIASVADVWAAVAPGEPMPANLLMAVNQEYVNTEAHVHDGDEVAFFPPVTGG